MFNKLLEFGLQYEEIFITAVIIDKDCNVIVVLGLGGLKLKPDYNFYVNKLLTIASFYISSVHKVLFLSPFPFCQADFPSLYP